MAGMTHAAIKKRTRMAHLGALFIFFTLVGAPLIILLIR